MNYNISRETPNMWNMGNGSDASIRVLHAVPDAPSVDVYANEQLIARDLSYSEYSDYISVPGGNYEIDVYAAGTRSNPVLRNMLMVNPNSIHTIAAIGTLESISLLAIPDNTVMMEPGKSMVRFSHLSPNAPAVDITLPDGTVLFRNVSYKELTPYIGVNPMNYTLQVRLAGTPTVVLTVPNVNLKQNMFQTVYAIGLAGGEPGLNALLVTDQVNQ